MEYIRISKVTIYSVLILIFAILGLTCFIIVFPDWEKYGISFLKYNHLERNLIPISIQVLRTLSYLSLILWIYLSFFALMQIKNIEDNKVKKILYFSLGIFLWIFIPYLFWLQYKRKYYLDFFKYLNSDIKENKNIIFVEKNSYNKGNIFYIIFSYLIFLITLTGFIFIFLPLSNFIPSRFEPYNPSSNFLFGSLSFLTQQSNLLLFLFMILFLFFGKKNIFRNNSILLSITSYILVVSIVYWTALFPNIVINGINKRYPNGYFLTSSLWFHLINPVFFISFSIWTFSINKYKPMFFLRLCSKYFVYPFIYGFYVYGLPFLTQFNTYGSLTNINPLSTPFYSDKYITLRGYGDSGRPENILFIIPIFFLFLICLFIFWFINAKVSKIDIKKNLLNKFN